MRFEKTVERDPNFPSRGDTNIFWLSDNGRYKVQEYFDTPEAPKRALYAAYYKPFGWTAFGNHVDRGNKFYTTVKAAKSACETHLASGE